MTQNDLLPSWQTFAFAVVGFGAMANAFGNRLTARTVVGVLLLALIASFEARFFSEAIILMSK